MNNQLLLSVIVPVYNVEQYIAQCINSLINQTYQNLEIIIVDDGSPDKCGVICDEFAKNDVRIQVFHIENGGFYNAQNFGLKHSTGDYVYFVDGDDYIDNKNAFNVLLEEAEKSNVDITVGNYHKDINGKLVSTNPHGFTNHTEVTTVDFRFKGFYSVGHLAYTWGKIYKRSFLMEHKLFMKPYLYSLDKLFNIECYIHNATYRFIQDSVYVYRMNDLSISHVYKKNFANIWLMLSDEVYSELKSIKNGIQYMDFVAFNIFFAVFFSSKQEYTQFGKSRKAIKTELKKFATNKLTHKVMKEFVRGVYISSISSFLWKMMIWGFSFAYSYKLYGLLSIGIKLLIECNIDGKLSSTGNPRHKLQMHRKRVQEWD